MHGAAPAGSLDEDHPNTAGGSSSSGGWKGFDEDDEEQLAIGQPPRTTSAQSRRGRAFKSKDYASSGRLWDGLQELLGLKAKPLTGERTIFINDAAANAPSKYSSNYVSTSKYNLVTFFPKFLFEQFSKYANLFFLFTGRASSLVIYDPELMRIGNSLHSTDPRCFAYQPIHHYCAPLPRLACGCYQGDAGGHQTTPIRQRVECEEMSRL